MGLSNAGVFTLSPYIYTFIALCSEFALDNCTTTALQQHPHSTLTLVLALCWYSWSTSGVVLGKTKSEQKQTKLRIRNISV
ncbi:hypothetical protein PEWE109479_11795 [Pedobacter westerhofensis]